MKNGVVVVAGSMDFTGSVKDFLVIVRAGSAATAYAKDSRIVTGAEGKNRCASVKGWRR